MLQFVYFLAAVVLSNLCAQSVSALPPKLACVAGRSITPLNLPSGALPLTGATPAGNPDILPQPTHQLQRRAAATGGSHDAGRDDAATQSPQPKLGRKPPPSPGARQAEPGAQPAQPMPRKSTQRTMDRTAITQRHAAYVRAADKLDAAELGALRVLTERAKPLGDLRRRVKQHLQRHGTPAPPELLADLEQARDAYNARMRFGAKVAKAAGALARTARDGDLESFVARTVRELRQELGDGVLERLGSEVAQKKEQKKALGQFQPPAEDWAAWVDRFLAEKGVRQKSWLIKHKAGGHVSSCFSDTFIHLSSDVSALLTSRGL
jgi:hypothetical protein